MTCIVGLVQDERVWMGADSASVSSWTVHTAMNSKLFVNGPLLIGTCGSWRVAQLLEYALVVPPGWSEDITKWMSTGLTDAMRSALRDGGVLKKKEEQEESPGESLIGVNGRLFVFSEDLCVVEHRGYAATGSGREVALGSLFTTRDVSDPQQRLGVALEAAAEHNIGVRPPFTVRVIGKERDLTRQ